MTFALQQASPGYSLWVYDISKCLFSSSLFMASGDFPGRGTSPISLHFSKMVGYCFLEVSMQNAGIN